jgi:hypothetical protein
MLRDMSASSYNAPTCGKMRLMELYLGKTQLNLQAARGTGYKWVALPALGRTVVIVNTRSQTLAPVHAH